MPGCRLAEAQAMRQASISQLGDDEAGEAGGVARGSEVEQLFGQQHLQAPASSAMRSCGGDFGGDAEASRELVVLCDGLDFPSGIRWA